MSRSRIAAGVAALALLGLSGVAVGLPWDIDMADGQQVKGYEVYMGTLPEGVVAQPSITSPKGYATNYNRTSPEGLALTNPLTVNDATVARGEAMYGIYCTPCHGNGAVLGRVAGSPPNRVPGVAYLAGPLTTISTRTDGYLYLTIRNGGDVMPAYGWAMSDEEIWSTVAYVRTLDNAAYKPPAPPTENP